MHQLITLLSRQRRGYERNAKIANCKMQSAKYCVYQREYEDLFPYVLLSVYRLQIHTNAQGTHTRVSSVALRVYPGDTRVHEWFDRYPPYLAGAPRTHV